MYNPISVKQEMDGSCGKEKTLEIWKDIEGFENYQVSTWGRIRSSHGILKPYENAKGYLKIGLSRDGKNHKKRVNRLVAMAFIPNSDNLPQVDHIDGNKQNNSITNLRWVDNNTNQMYANELRQLAKALEDSK